MIATHGFGFPKNVMQTIINAANKKGIIIFTDPDFAGEKIRQRIVKQVPFAKHAFLPQEEAKLDGDIGIENASPENILKALQKVRTLSEVKSQEFTQHDMIENKLNFFANSAQRRAKLGALLGIGYANSKQFLARLNDYLVTRDEFNEAILKMNNEHQEDLNG